MKLLNKQQHFKPTTSSSTELQACRLKFTTYFPNLLHYLQNMLWRIWAISMQQFQWNQIFSWPLETFRLHINRCEVIFDSLNPNDWRQLKCNNTLLSGDLSRRRNSLSREPLLQSWTVFRELLAVTLLNHTSWLVCFWTPLNQENWTMAKRPSLTLQLTKEQLEQARKNRSRFSSLISGLKLQKLVEDDDNSSGGEWLGGAEQKGWWESWWRTWKSKLMTFAMMIWWWWFCR